MPHPAWLREGGSPVRSGVARTGLRPRGAPGGRYRVSTCGQAPVRAERLRRRVLAVGEAAPLRFGHGGGRAARRRPPPSRGRALPPRRASASPVRARSACPAAAAEGQVAPAGEGGPGPSAGRGGGICPSVRPQVQGRRPSVRGGRDAVCRSVCEGRAGRCPPAGACGGPGPCRPGGEERPGPAQPAPRP